MDFSRAVMAGFLPELLSGVIWCCGPLDKASHRSEG
jgi:hypothetical protein